jgi:hypothetical protein
MNVAIFSGSRRLVLLIKNMAALNSIAPPASVIVTCGLVFF